MWKGTEKISPEAGLYIHIPFCRAKCYYCDFCSRPPSDAAMMERYVDRLIEELDARAPRLRPRTVYLGGGTPSQLPASQLQMLFSAIDMADCQETTIEVNPEDVTSDFVAMLRDTPVSRVSMGVQSLIDSELSAIGRRHTAAEACRAYERLRHAGISNISLDLMYGLPGQTADSWRHSLSCLIALRPEHISAYHLTYEPGTRLHAMLQRGKVSEAEPELSERMYLALCDLTAKAGYEHYEISNLALPGYRSRHNSSYWNSTPYIGIGVAAHSFDGSARRYNRADIKQYLDNGFGATLTDDPETTDEQYNDLLITRLRTADGLLLRELAERFGPREPQLLRERARAAIDAGHIADDGLRLTIPERHWLISDAILLPLIK